MTYTQLKLFYRDAMNFYLQAKSVEDRTPTYWRKLNKDAVALCEKYNADEFIIDFMRAIYTEMYHIENGKKPLSLAEDKQIFTEAYNKLDTITAADIDGTQTGLRQDLLKVLLKRRLGEYG